jgi:hypothetical protein
MIYHISMLIILFLIASYDVHCQSQVDAGFFYCHHRRFPMTINGDVSVRILLFYSDSSSIEPPSQSYQNVPQFIKALKKLLLFCI